MNKELKTIDVTLIGCGDEATVLTASDTATDPQATYALDEFGKKDQMHFANDGKTYYVPFHAVDHIEVEKTTTTVADKPDPYGCDGGGETKGEVWFTGVMPNECNSAAQISVEPTDIADISDLYNNYQNYSVAINGIELPYSTNEYDATSFGNIENIDESTLALTMDTTTAAVLTVCENFSAGTPIEVTVSHK